MAQIVDIEALVIWAFRDQKADLVVGRGAGLHEIEAAADGRPRQGGSNVGSLIQYAALGTKIDEPGPDLGLVDPDAERIYEAVLTLNAACKGLVCRHGRGASRPDYGAGLRPRMAPAWKDKRRFDHNGLPAKGAVRMIYDRNRHPIACRIYPVIIETDDDDERAIVTAVTVAAI